MGIEKRKIYVYLMCISIQLNVDLVQINRKRLLLVRKLRNREKGREKDADPEKGILYDFTCF